MQQVLFMFSRLAAFIIMAFCIWETVTTLVEAFGGGPPFYGRTTNMDKWVNPIPALLLINAIGLIIAFALLKLVRKP
jgi:hypothetical protein